MNSEPGMKKSYSRLPSLTSGRGVAALFVLLYHANFMWPTKLAPVMSAGWLGVTYFFILSGFVLTWSFLNEKSSREFLLERIARIFPIHIVTLFVAILGYLVLRAPFGGYVSTSMGTIANLFLVHDWIPGHPYIRQGWNGVSWSLSCEWFFYIFAPSVVRWIAKMNNREMLKLGIALFSVHFVVSIVVVHFSFDRAIDFIEFSPFARVPEFIYGIIAARLLMKGDEMKIRLSVVLLAVVPIACYLCFVPNRAGPIMVDLCVPLFILCIMYLAVRDIKFEKNTHRTGFLHKVGEYSFCLYMTHALVLASLGWLVSRFSIHTTHLIFTLTFVVVSLAVAKFAVVTVEVPARKFLLNRGRRFFVP